MWPCLQQGSAATTRWGATSGNIRPGGLPAPLNLWPLTPAPHLASRLRCIERCTCRRRRHSWWRTERRCCRQRQRCSRLWRRRSTGTHTCRQGGGGRDTFSWADKQADWRHECPWAVPVHAHSLQVASLGLAGRGATALDGDAGGARGAGGGLACRSIHRLDWASSRQGCGPPPSICYNTRPAGHACSGHAPAQPQCTEGEHGKTAAPMDSRRALSRHGMAVPGSLVTVPGLLTPLQMHLPE